MPKKPAFLQWITLILGIVLTAAPYPLLLIPSDIAPGGVTGIATLIYTLTGLPVGFLAALINAPLFLISWRRLGHAFAIKSLIGMLGVSAVIDLLPMTPLTTEPILASLFGGLISGIGLGLVIRAGATTGGTDMAATLIHRKFPSLTVGGILLALDGCVIIASAFIYSIQSALYALIAVFVMTKAIDRVVEGLESAKAFFVFSPRSEEIAQKVMKSLDRGATLLHGMGAYSGEEREVLLCVVMRQQISQFKSIVKEIDPLAFMMVTDVREAVGEGFTRAPKEE